MAGSIGSNVQVFLRKTEVHERPRLSRCQPKSDRRHDWIRVPAPTAAESIRPLASPASGSEIARRTSRNVVRSETCVCAGPLPAYSKPSTSSARSFGYTDLAKLANAVEADLAAEEGCLR
jgi:hypothetical protein